MDYPLISSPNNSKITVYVRVKIPEWSEITLVEGEKYEFETYDVPVKIIEDSLRELKE